MPINFKELQKMDLYIQRGKPMRAEEKALLSKIIAESKKKNAKLVARIEAKMKNKKTPQNKKQERN